MEFTLFQYLAICSFIFIAGFVDSIAGGGGLISLPAYFAAGLPPHAALATNKFSSVCGTFTSVVRYWRAGAVSAVVGLWAAAGALIGSAVGARAVLLVPAPVVLSGMLVVVPLALAVFLLRDRVAPGAAGSRGKARSVAVKSFVIGVVIGGYDGFYGPGTGTFLAIAFSAFLGLGLLSASGNARLANLASNLGSVAVFLYGGRVLFPLALYAAAAGIAGNLVGSRLAVEKGDRIIRPLMVAVLFLLLATVVWRRWF
jgi:uncharacterized membrane protein YfcA